MRLARVFGAAVTTAALILVSGSPAHAGTSVSSWGTSMKSGCSTSSHGKFEDYGEWFRLTDTCADGWSAVMRVDVAPYQSNNGYDFVIWNSNGNGTTVSVNKSYAEGTGVCIQAGSGERSSGEWGSWGYWTCGVA
ncbi:hypothetical protein GA0074695_1829 [Micromonospora viridifaciens]|uniref:Peptidase inhibitor family I36 n=1 Tax=Micromonospora viridifaciens TaxID=1881 RepID=A0A1C4VVE1_MICVI|nr:hypothetical protein [Micromonospora viridifaciens]SCE87937.1 hypothetical protein GA0074695_1829 [Micromonospora viridifaciens]